MGYYGFDLLHMLGLVVWGFASLIGIAIVVTIAILLVRFLLVATTAARLYVAKNGPAKASTADTPPVATPTVVASAAAPAKVRTPKNPPAV